MSKQERIKDIDKQIHKLQSEKKALENGPPKPIPLESIDWTNLIKTAQACIDEAFKRGYFDDDDRHYIYEAAMTAIFGSDYFKLTNHLQV